jgi:hypothetical protein
MSSVPLKVAVVGLFDVVGPKADSLKPARVERLQGVRPRQRLLRPGQGHQPALPMRHCKPIHVDGQFRCDRLAVGPPHSGVP